MEEEQPCQPSENPVHPSSFTWINPVQLCQQPSANNECPLQTLSPQVAAPMTSIQSDAWLPGCHKHSWLRRRAARCVDRRGGGRLKKRNGCWGLKMAWGDFWVLLPTETVWPRDWLNIGRKIIFTELAPRPIQSISCNVGDTKMSRSDPFWPMWTLFDPFWPFFHPFSPMFTHFHPFSPALTRFDPFWPGT